MNVKRQSRSLTLFYILVTYVILQLVWWAVHIIQLTNQLNQPNDYIERRIWMIAGEGLVFISLLIFGVFQIKKAFKKEMLLAQQKQNFALSVSHELKTPVAAIKLFLQTLSKHNLSEEKQEEIIRKSIANANRLDDLLSNILLSNVVEEGSYHLTKETIDLEKVCSDIISYHTSINKDAIITLNFIGEKTISSDKTLLQSILNNLIENALKYSPAPQSVKVNIEVQKNTINIDVSDNGIGVVDEDKESIFDKFYRSGNELTRQNKGTGLGLYIVKEITHLLHGTISVQSNTPKGAIFSVKIPLK